jgi:hypothetical protein
MRLRPALFTLLLILSTAFAPAAPAAAPADDKPRVFRFAVIGDTGTGDEPQHATARQMAATFAKTPFQHVLMLGDNIYSDNFAKIDQVFATPYKELLAKGVLFHATLGNHDKRSAADQMKYPGFNMGGRPDYSFRPADDLVEFFTIDSTAVLEGRGPDQMVWLDKALEASKARWKIVYFHHPPYSPGSRHGDDPAVISKILPTLKKRGARVVLTGHEHFFAKIATRDGIDFFISGSGGKIHRKAINRQYPGLEAADDESHHFVLVTLTDDSLEWEAIGSTGASLGKGAVPLVPKAAK